MKRFFDNYGYEFEMYNDLVAFWEGERYIYDEVYENLYGVFELTSVFSDVEFLSKETKEKMQAFQDKWYAYIESTEYSRNGVFVYLDEAFITILDHELTDFLNNFNQDLKENGYSDFTDLSNLERKLPTHEDILKSIANMYRVLPQ